MGEIKSRPWDRPGCFRRDCMPHRGDFLHLLGTGALVCGVLSVVLLPLSVPAAILGGVAMSMAERDLSLMNKGLMDPTGEEQTRGAYKRCLRGAILGLSSSLLLLGLAVLLAVTVITGY